MADVKFVEQKKIRLKKNLVYQGGVYFTGNVISVDSAFANILIAEGRAEALTPEAPKAPAKEKADK